MKDQDCLSLSDSCDEPIQAVDSPTFPASRFLKHIKVKRRGSQSGRSRSSLFVQSSVAPWPGPHVFACFLRTGAYFSTAFGNRSSFNALFIPECSLLSSTVWDLQSWLKLPTWIFSLFQASFRTMCLAVSSWRLTLFLGEHWVMVCLLGTNHEVFYF